MGDSDKTRAINVFRKHKAKINKSDINQWLRYAADLTDRYIGPETQLRVGWASLLSYDVPNLLQRATSLIDQCIESIEDNGIYKPSNKNFLMTLSNGELITLIGGALFAAIGGSWVLGMSYNQFRIDKVNEENLRLESELKRSTTEIRYIKQRLAISEQKNKGLTTHPISTTPINTTAK